MHARQVPVAVVRKRDRDLRRHLLFYFPFGRDQAGDAEHALAVRLATMSAEFAEVVARNVQLDPARYLPVAAPSTSGDGASTPAGDGGAGRGADFFDAVVKHLIAALSQPVRGLGGAKGARAARVLAGWVLTQALVTGPQRGHGLQSTLAAETLRRLLATATTLVRTTPWSLPASVSLLDVSSPRGG